MFDKIPSLKDFILYVVPGIIYCYFITDIYIFFKGESYYISDIDNSSLSFIGIIFSFLVGFLLTQFKIILFNKIYEKKLSKIRTIKETQKSNEEIKNTLINRIQKVFNLSSIDENDDLIIFLCLNYVKIKTNENSHIYIDRDNNLSSFALATILPSTLALFDFFIQNNFSLTTSLLSSIFLLIILFILVKKIVFNFRDIYYKNIFRQFIVLSE